MQSLMMLHQTMLCSPQILLISPQSVAEYYQYPARGPYTLSVRNTAAYLPLQSFAQDYQIPSLLADQIASANTTAELRSYLPPGSDKTVLAGYIAQLSQLALTLSNPSASQLILEAFQTAAFPNTSVPQLGALLKPLSRVSSTPRILKATPSDILIYGTVSNPLDLEIMAAFVPLFRKVWGAPSLKALASSRRGGDRSRPGRP